jgi:hypothetical protein
MVSEPPQNRYLQQILRDFSPNLNDFHSFHISLGHSTQVLVSVLDASTPTRRRSFASNLVRPGAPTSKVLQSDDVKKENRLDPGRLRRFWWARPVLLEERVKPTGGSQYESIRIS